VKHSESSNFEQERNKCTSEPDIVNKEPFDKESTILSQITLNQQEFGSIQNKQVSGGQIPFDSKEKKEESKVGDS